jgi:hypothetical protein
MAVAAAVAAEQALQVLQALQAKVTALGLRDRPPVSALKAAAAELRAAQAVLLPVGVVLAQVVGEQGPTADSRLLELLETVMVLLEALQAQERVVRQLRARQARRARLV